MSRDGITPDFDRLLLEFDEPAIKNLLVDLDEQGRDKTLDETGNVKPAAEPAVRLRDLLDTLEVAESSSARRRARPQLRDANVRGRRRTGPVGTIDRARNEHGKAFPRPWMGESLARSAATIPANVSSRPADDVVGPSAPMEWREGGLRWTIPTRICRNWSPKERPKGYLTYDEVNDYLPDEAVNPEKLDNLLIALDEEGIELVNEPPPTVRSRQDGAEACCGTPAKKKR